MKSKITLVTLFLVICACQNPKELQIEKDWKVVKMEKMENVTSNSQFPIKIEIDSKMAYNFKSDKQVDIITQNGNTLSGKWSVADTTLTIFVKGETKIFKIEKLNESQLILTSAKFKFYLEH